MTAFRWRHLAAAWAIVLALGVLSVGGSALMPGVDTAQAAPELRSVDRQYTPSRLDRFPSEAVEMND
jgi:hypothetical protein